MKSSVKRNMPPEKRMSDNEENSDVNERIVVSKSPPMWNKGDRLLRKWIDGHYYEVKILLVNQYEDQPVYTVHYVGWNNKYDEKLAQDQAIKICKPYTKQAHEEAMIAIKKAKLEAKHSHQMKKPSLGSPNVSNEEGSLRSEKSSHSSGSKRARIADETFELISNGKTIQNIDLTTDLKGILEEDRDFIFDEKMVPIVPARATVFRIIDEYRRSLVKNDESSGKRLSQLFSKQPEKSENADKFAEKLLGCFEILMQDEELIYSSEKPILSLHLKNTADIHSFNDDQKLANKFGIVYLLRLLVRLPILMAEQELPEEDIKEFLRQAEEFVAFLDEHCKDYFEGRKEYGDI